jgi:hypothetical protein
MSIAILNRQGSFFTLIVSAENTTVRISPDFVSSLTSKPWTSPSSLSLRTVGGLRLQSYKNRYLELVGQGVGQIDKIIRNVADPSCVRNTGRALIPHPIKEERMAESPFTSPAVQETPMSKLAEYGGRLIQTDGRPTVEIANPNNDRKRLFQFRQSAEGIERRILQSDGEPLLEGSPWKPCDLLTMQAVRGNFHPVLDPLGFGNAF